VVDRPAEAIEPDWTRTLAEAISVTTFASVATRPLVVPETLTVWLPADAVGGTEMLTLNPPWPVTDAVGIPFVEPSHAIWTVVRGTKPVPARVSVTPPKARVGLIVKVGDAPVTRRGSAPIASAPTITRATSETLCPLSVDLLRAGTSLTHPFPSQKVIG